MARNKMGGIKAEPNKGKDLKGLWQITLKIDGARMHRDSKGNPVSRAGKPLYNLDHIDKEITDAEVYDIDWETSMSLVRTSVNGKPVPREKVYSLDPLDARLDLGTFKDPDHAFLQRLMESKVDEGYEGLIVRQGNKWLKYKPSDSADVKVTGFQAGTGKHEGRMGALLTNYGKLGTGFDDKQREMFQEMFDKGELIGILVECQFMEWTKNGKMRHPVFVRIRDDKTEESLGEAYESMFNLSEE